MSHPQRLSFQHQQMSPENKPPDDATRSDDAEYEVIIRSDGSELTPKEVAALKAHINGQLGINPFRRFVRLSSSYRSALYGLLEKEHPGVFQTDDEESLREASVIMYEFLKRRLEENRIEVNDDVFHMLFLDFIGSRDFYVKRTRK